MEQYNDSADAPDVRTRRYRGTIASPSAVQSGDYLFRSNHEYWNGTSLLVGGAFAFDNTNNAARTQFSVAVDTDGTGADPQGTNGQFKIDGNDGGAITFNNAYKFPTTDGSANQVLATDGSGTLSFVDQTGGGGSGHTIQNAGSSLTDRANLNFDGTYLVATDDAGNDQTDVTIGSGVVTTTGTQTLTNKTLTSPNMTSPAIGGTTITATAAELNILDGVTATTTELNYTDGVTSNIQTQLDAKLNLADSISINNLVNTAASGIIESNANFVDTCLVGPSVDGKAWAGKFENGSVWSSLMLATVETSGSDAEVNIWDLTDYTLTSATPLATVTLTGATPTSIAASMGYLIVGTSDQGAHIVDPHDGSWAERTYGWPRSLTASTSPALSDNNVQSVNATIAGGAPYDPRTGGSVPTFVIGLGATKDFDGIMDNGTVVAASTNTSLSNIVGVHNDFLIYESNTAGNTYYGSISYARDNASWSIAQLDGSGAYPLTGTINTIRSGAQQTLVGRSDGLISYFGSYLPGSVTNSILAQNRTSEAWATAAITNAYNSGYMPGQVNASCVLAALANSKTADRSGYSNTLTENGTVPSAAVATGAELTAYGPYSTTNFLNRTDSDFNTGTGAFTVLVWAKETSNDGSTRMMATWGAYSGAFTGNGQWSVYVYGGSTAGNRAVGMNCSDDNYSTQDALNTTVDAPQDVYNLYAFVFDFPNAQMRVYLNGQKIGEGSTSNCTTVANASGSIIIGKRHDGASPFDLGLETLFRHSTTALSDTQIAKIYEAEKGMFVANAKCLLQGAGNAVLDARIDPLTGKYIVTQSDTQDIFDGLTIDTERTIAAGGTTFEHGLLWGDGVAEINDANLYASMPATDQRQVNEIVRSMAAELPAGVDLSKAKAWCVQSDNGASPSTYASYNIESVALTATGTYKVTFAKPFKRYSPGAGGNAQVGYAGFVTANYYNFGAITVSGTLSTNEYAEVVTNYHDGVRYNSKWMAVFFGELEDE